MNPLTLVLVLALVQFGAVKGKVTQVDGTTPVKNLRVDAYEALTKTLINSNKTDTLGIYVIGNLPTGNYKIRTWNLSGPYWSEPYVNMYYNNTLYWDSSSTVAVNDPDTVPNINISVPAGGNIQGRVFQSDSITSYKGFCLIAAFYKSVGEISMAGFADTGNGIYRIGGLPPGWYKIEYMPYGESMADDLIDTIYAFEYYHNANDWAIAESIYVAPMDSVLGINAVMDTGGTISGHVYQQDGATPMSGVKVTCWQYGNQYYGWSSIVSDTTDVSGQYKLAALRTGNHRVSATKSGYDTLWYDNEVDSSIANLVPVTMPNNTPNIDFNMQITGVAEEYIAEGIQPHQKIKLTISPNPVSSKAAIKYVITANSSVMLDIYNISGQRVKRLAPGEINPGTYMASWSGQDENNQRMPNGVYICRLVWGGNSTAIKMLLLR
ncbi:MAG: hypothetical protein A2509_08615 [Candidatus Edwardsbacteria bacterium RIFOXYD12_FULL_50_11]|uniref:FlgD/Vpr Ig-like domain-containing protein n=1 Tax=Candidatus Edwardsbacteria bacterium GWF2_54_11 TaxID=1817851 RepID=A0A1F5RFU1_9BACT|nr:MAG: hypothetical protein A2502_01985 [Candidatus Edwardsbacteria bacterium RifOxyC12_full_54_24]OGF09034.1 MAG: hypothetical protein A2273_10440 [Candidatus Edwardsbacteria bacterium RifOxyA12_full_54_48]OGF12440.1 MAG: hypothetical protein A3K15_01155 [Candidatus Edwardsbacteria bacterium GWE2_54_12]OGF12921.1 MAG: hypothetical protein A2024_11895 [Candidatus Edwardsbacteria bacterium GWF2_54_11]OGF17455.1 MAG: hypothetical protein A2509_08615 [Candidatus Edwardsbacteria bacterium RIFOXYD1